MNESLWVDLSVIAAYIVFSIYIGRRLGGTSTNSRSYFTSDGDIPWWASSLSIVATETSLLTVLSTPALAYGGNLSFLQIAMGYIFGRVIVAFWILPIYFKHSPESTYAYLGARFGVNFRKMVSTTFIFTRILADGVRLFAAAIPIYILTGFDYKLSILVLCFATLVYTYSGGLKSVIWVDVLQWGTFLISGFLLIGFLISNGATFDIPSEKWTVFQFPDSFSTFLTSAYTFPAAFFGGAILSMASHGTDHIIVQRILACKNEHEGKKALLASGIVVFLQFSIFLIAGLLLFNFYGGKTPSEIGLNRGDEIVMHFVNLHFPVGFKGFFVAGLLAAAMSTLSSSLSALSSSTLFDLFPKLAHHPKSLLYSRLLMVFWCVVFAGFASSFTSTNSPVIEIGLSIAGFTYGALLGALVCSKWWPISRVVATIGFFATLAFMIWVVKFTTLAWPWYTAAGVLCYAMVAYIGYLVTNRPPQNHELVK